MKDEIKEILLKDFNEILVKEFCTDWKEKRLYIELLVNSTPFSNLLNYITNLQTISDNRMKALLKIEQYCIDEKEDLISGREVCEDVLKIIDELKGK